MGILLADCTKTSSEYTYFKAKTLCVSSSTHCGIRTGAHRLNTCEIVRAILIVIELNLPGTFDQIIWLAHQNGCLLFYMIPVLLDGDLLKYVK